MAILVWIYRQLGAGDPHASPCGGMYGRPLGLTALLCLVAQTITGLTVDLRFFDFPNIIVMLLAGARDRLAQPSTAGTSSARGSRRARRPRQPAARSRRSVLT